MWLPQNKLDYGWLSINGSTGGGSSLTEDTTGAAFALKFDEYWDNFTGITIPAGATQGFYASGADSNFDVGTTDQIVIKFVIQKSANAGAEVFLDTATAGANPNGSIECYFHTAGTAATIYVVDDTGNILNYSPTLNTNCTDGLIHTYHIIFDRQADTLLLKQDGVACGAAADASGLTANISCNRFSLGSNAATNYGLNGTMYECYWIAGTTTGGNATGPGSSAPYTYENTNATGVKGHWKFQESSGDITDSKNSKVLADYGSPTYSVAGAGKAAALYDEIAGVKLVPGGADILNQYSWNETVGGGDAWLSPGVEIVSAGNNVGFTCLDASSLDWTCNDGLTIEIWLTKTTAAGTHYLLAQNHAVADTDYGILAYFSGETSLRLYMQDDTELAVGDKTWTISALDDAAIHKLRFWVDPNGSGNATLWIDGASQGTGDFSALVGKTMTSKKLWLGGQYNGGTASFVGKFWFMRITHGLVNSGGE